MKLKKCLSITKCEKFSVFIYPKGHVKEKRGMDEVPLKIFDVERNEKGEISYSEFLEFLKCEVTEIIPHSSGVNIVAELTKQPNKDKLIVEYTSLCLEFSNFAGPDPIDAEREEQIINRLYEIRESLGMEPIILKAHDSRSKNDIK